MLTHEAANRPVLLHPLSDATEVIEVNVFDGSHIGVPGVVDQNVDATPTLDRGVDGTADLLVVGDVERDNGQTLRFTGSEIVER